MLQLKVPFSHNEAEVLVRCLTQLEARSTGSVSSARHKNSSIFNSARQKVDSNLYNDFQHDEIIHMVYALDHLARECSKQMTENTPQKTVEELSDTLRTVATARTKLRRAVIAD